MLLVREPKPALIAREVHYMEMIETHIFVYANSDGALLFTTSHWRGGHILQQLNGDRETTTGRVFKTQLAAQRFEKAGRGGEGDARD